MKTNLCPLFLIITIILTVGVFNVFASNDSFILSVENSWNPQSELVLLKDDFPVKITLVKKDAPEASHEIVQPDAAKWSAKNGTARTLSGGTAILWTPAKPGASDTITFNYTGDIKNNGKNDKVNISISVNIISAVSYKKHFKDGKILDYTVGEYLDPNDKEKMKQFEGASSWPQIYPDKFLPPAFFYIVTKEIKDYKISKNYTLGDYALDYPWYSIGMPQALAIDYGLITKIEELQELMNADGYSFKKFEILYGWRPPSFNLGTIIEDGAETLKVPFSQHQFGKAIDLIIDTSGDLVMDDLNKDGKSDIHDAAVIMHYVNILDRKYRDAKDPRMGGAGLYTHHDFKGRKQSPYIHIDTRDFTTDSGSLIRWPNKWPDGTAIKFSKI